MLDLSDLLLAGGQLYGTPHKQNFTDFSYDSRLTQPGELFIALRTPRADGHDYITSALQAGATGVLCTWPPLSSGTATVILDPDPAMLLQRWATQRLQTVAPTVVAVTGSVGKTSTVRAITTLLSQHVPTFRSRQSFNSLLGLPLALARLQSQHQFAVLEYGADRFGEIARLAALFPPQVAVVTAVAAAHLDAFGTLDGVAREKGALVEALPADGWAILNGDDPLVAALCQRTHAQVLTFGRNANNDLRADAIQSALDATTCIVHWRDQSIRAHIPLIGEPAVNIALAAVGVALACGLSLRQAVQGLALVEPESGRLRALPMRGGATLLDDSFSAAQPAMTAALHSLHMLPARRRIAILGAPAVSNATASEAYADIGALAGASSDILICQGDWGTTAIQAARRVNSQITATLVHTAAAALAALPSDIGPGDVVLVKGDAEARMERVAAGLLDPQVPAAQVLVRQEPAWRSVRVGATDRPTWVRIDLDAIAHNIRRLHTIAGVPLMVTLKADAYGHGAVRVAHTALVNGASALAVATLSEARVLRNAGISAPILIFGYTPPWQAREAIVLDVACTIFDFDAAQALTDAANALERTARVHVKVDTGMGRLGLAPAQVGAFLNTLHTDPRYAELRITGLYTHFATADSADETFAHTQLQRFTQVLEEISAAGLRPSCVHAANSAALLRFPAARFDMVRPGLACYGLSPSIETPLPADFRPALSFYSEVAQVKSVAPGTPLSYGGTFITQRAAHIATIPVGYADGVRRSPPWRAVLVHGQRAPIVGRINMDYALLDVTEIPDVKRGDPVTLIGSQGTATITADEVAEWLGTNNYEVVTTILPRVPREVEA